MRTRETLELVGPAFATSTVLLEDALYTASSDELLARCPRPAGTS